jgi:hypothetical protein
MKKTLLVLPALLIVNFLSTPAYACSAIFIRTVTTRSMSCRGISYGCSDADSAKAAAQAAENNCWNGGGPEVELAEIPDFLQ